MKIAIHPVPGSFSDAWLEYCREKQIPTKLVNGLDFDIISQLEDSDGLMWHWSHGDTRAKSVARQLAHSLDYTGKKIFPDIRTCWHYDDKVGQMYLMDALGVPHVPTYVFYDKKKALDWIEDAAFPKVFKLGCGAASANVRLIHSKSQARRIVRRAFGHGFSPLNRWSLFKDRIWHLKRDRNLKALTGLGRGLARLAVPTDFEKRTPREEGYVYFQDFIPGNSFDIRVVAIGNRAFGIKRLARAGDFRASGSGSIRYGRDEIDLSCVKRSFEISRQMRSECMAFDYIFSVGGALLTEMSYAFQQSGYRECPGYWDEELSWHEGRFFPEWFMVEDFVASIKR